MSDFLAFTLEDREFSVYVHTVEIVTCKEVLHIYQYSVIMKLSGTKNRLINLYRKFSGEWINYDTEDNDNLISIIKSEIEKHDGESGLSIRGISLA